MDASSCRDESESGGFLIFEDLDPGTVLIRLRRGLEGDYPNFAIEVGSAPGGSLRFLLHKPIRPVAPQILTESGKWKPLLVEGTPAFPAFRVPLTHARSVIRLWDPDEEIDTHAGEAPGVSGLDGPRRLGLAASCANACYAPRNLLCYDFNRLECYLDGIRSHPFVDVDILGYTAGCPGVPNHIPKAIYRVRITDPSIPIEEKTRIVITARVHGGERLSSFLVEGIMEFALGNEVLPEGEGFLPELPETPPDLLEKLDLVIYPSLNPDGAQDLDGDGESDYSRYKCGVDMNRRWGMATEETDAWEVHLIHEDILRESAVKPFAFHRDFHSWSELEQGGFRHGIGTWEDENNEPAITVDEEYFERENDFLDVEESRVFYRARENYVINSHGLPPIPGTARFALYEEFASAGLITDTSETAHVVRDGQVLSFPAYRGGADVRHEGAWLLVAHYEALVGPTGGEEPDRFIRGDANDDESVDLADAVKVLLYLFTGVTIRCQAAADLDENALINVSDAAYILNYQFRNGPPPPAPFPSSGPSSGEYPLGCAGD